MKANPCKTCKEKELAKLGACNAGFGICKARLDYENAKRERRMTHASKT